MVTFATITSSAGATLRWIAVSTTLGRYERGSNQIRSHVKNLIQSLGQAVAPFGTIATAYDNSGDVAFTHGTTISPVSRTDVRAVVGVSWRSTQRRGSASGQGGEACRFAGELEVTLLAPRNTGDGVLRRCADYLADSLRDAETGEVRFEVPTVVPGVIAENSAPGQTGHGHCALTVSVPFYLDEDNARATPSAGTQASIDDYGSVCRTRFRDEIATGRGLVTVHDNAPDHGIGSEEWCALEIIDGGTTRATLGAGFARYRTTGILQASLYAPINTGDETLIEIADEFFDAFHAVADRGVQFQVPAIVESGRDGPYWRVIVQVPFTAEQIQ